ncbi:hypothetical protein NZK35_25245 [Stieleria sp. ICT_E10.1]|uniref:DUF6794 domain-containing protein n=1 Tax=Stieleria sedimenti TaxID=2976331 RepID=UPI0021809710|nr:DUF6794 domain-containing protein [Stieleria sedimenti]MCS7469970.1 hypothetical protein [Stieleria sedimenti]
MIDRDSVPSSVEPAARQLAASLSSEHREQIRSGQELDHFGSGLSIRNDWSLWDTDSPLKRDAATNTASPTLTTSPASYGPGPSRSSDA